MTRVRHRPTLEALAGLGIGMALMTIATTDWQAATEPIFCHSPAACRVMLDVDGPVASGGAVSAPVPAASEGE